MFEKFHYLICITYSHWYLDINRIIRIWSFYYIPQGTSQEHTSCIWEFIRKEVLVMFLTRHSVIVQLPGSGSCIRCCWILLLNYLIIQTSQYTFLPAKYRTLIKQFADHLIICRINRYAFISRNYWIRHFLSQSSTSDESLMK